MENKGAKWGWVIFWLIIFWPAGLYLLFKKLSTDKSALMSGKTNKLSVIGWILIVIGAFGFTEDISETGDMFGVFLGFGFIIGGILLLRKASQTKKLATKYKKYLNIIVNQDVRSIDYVASAVGLPYNIVQEELQNMIDIGYLKEAYIHQGNREIVVIETDLMTEQNATSSGHATYETIVEHCRGCGARNVVTVGRSHECDYCGTPLSA